MKVLIFYGSLLNVFERSECRIEADAKAQSKKTFKHKQAEKLCETGLMHLIRVCEELLSSNFMLRSSHFADTLDPGGSRFTGSLGV